MTEAQKRKIAVVAIGGNSLIKDGKHQSVECTACHTKQVFQGTARQRT